MNAIVVNIYLLFGAVRDIKKKKITNHYLWTGAIMGVIIKFLNYGEATAKSGEWLLAFIPGVLMLILAKITEEKIGYGDGWLIVILGNYMTVSEISILLQISIILIFLFSVIVLCGKMATKTCQIPFLPFLWISHLLVWRLGYV